MNEGAERTEKGTPRRHEDTESMRVVVSAPSRLRDGHFSVSCVPSAPRSFPRIQRDYRVGSLPTANFQLTESCLRTDSAIA
ncbi:hypothetical protein BH24ACI4_BH24ACI4_10440 [soil metagenome]